MIPIVGKMVRFQRVAHVFFGRRFLFRLPSRVGLVLREFWSVIFCYFRRRVVLCRFFSFFCIRPSQQISLASYEKVNQLSRLGFSWGVRLFNAADNHARSRRFSCFKVLPMFDLHNARIWCKTLPTRRISVFKVGLILCYATVHGPCMGHLDMQQKTQQVFRRQRMKPILSSRDEKC